MFQVELRARLVRQFYQQMLLGNIVRCALVLHVQELGWPLVIVEHVEDVGVVVIQGEVSGMYQEAAPQEGFRVFSGIEPLEAGLCPADTCRGLSDHYPVWATFPRP